MTCEKMLLMLFFRKCFSFSKKFGEIRDMRSASAAKVFKAVVFRSRQFQSRLDVLLPEFNASIFPMINRMTWIARKAKRLAHHNNERNTLSGCQVMFLEFPMYSS